MAEGERRLLLVCHVAAMDGAAQAARKIWGEESEVDLLCYGRASTDLPAPAGANLIDLPVQDGVSPGNAIRMLGGLRRRDYHEVALAQPQLGLSRARALLLAFVFAVGGRRATILDPAAARVVRPISFALVAAELVRWLALQAVAWLSASAATAVAKRLADLSPPGCEPVGSGQSVLYLRTDVDLVVSALRAGGSVAHTEGILDALCGRGYSVTFVSTGEIDGVPDSVRQARLPAVLKGNLPTEIAELLSGLVQGMAPLRGLRPTGFIYQRYSLNNLAGAILSARWTVPLVLEANGSEAKWRQDFSLLRYPRLAYACERLILRRSRIVSAVSANAAADLIAAGAPASRLRVVPNGVNAGRFASADPMPLADLRGKFVICFVGLFYPWHGVRYLAEAFATFHDRCPDARLLLVGDGEEAPVARSVLARHGALDATHFAGLVPRADAPRYMAAADVLVSPHADVHNFIGSPIKLFEYMAAGKAIVATRVGQIQEVLCDGETGLLVEPENADAMARAFGRLREDAGLRTRLGLAAQREAFGKHSWEARLAAVLD
jgi:glycosyltransferase involved in cell wall biosynthesis